VTIFERLLGKRARTPAPEPVVPQSLRIELHGRYWRERLRPHRREAIRIVPGDSIDINDELTREEFAGPFLRLALTEHGVLHVTIRLEPENNWPDGVVWT